MVTKKFNPETNVLEVAFNGETDMNEILNYHQGIINDESLPRELKILYDTSHSTSDSSATNIILYSERFKDILSKYTFIKSAFVLNSTHLDVFAKLYKHLMEGVTNYKCELFKTKEEALAYLLK